jgi:ribosome-associated protein
MNPSPKESPKSGAKAEESSAEISVPEAERALACARAAIDKKAENVRILDLRRISGFTDFFVICSASNDRQVQAIADSVLKDIRATGAKVIATEGYEDSRWILIDFGDVVVHVFLDPLREYYGLEQLWAGAPRVAVPSEYYGPGVTRLN